MAEQQVQGWWWWNPKKCKVQKGLRWRCADPCEIGNSKWSAPKAHEKEIIHNGYQVFPLQESKYLFGQRAALKKSSSEVNQLQRRDCSLDHCQVLRQLSPKEGSMMRLFVRKCVRKHARLNGKSNTEVTSYEINSVGHWTTPSWNRNGIF